MEFKIEEWMPQIVEYGINIFVVILILIVGRIVAGIGRSIVKRMLRKSSTDEAVVSFVGSLVYILVLAAAVLAALSTGGIQTASFIAILGAAGFAIGFALQGSLANFAAGVLLLVFRPFRVDDVIDAAGVVGKVVEIHLFTTILHTADNVKIFVPNGQIYGSVIKNITANDTRRVDMLIGIGYGDSIGKAHEIVMELLKADSRVLAEPEPMIAVAELADSSVNLHVRPWVKKEDYWGVRFDMTRQIKERFDAEGIEIPFPQRTVHMVSDNNG